MIKQIKDIFEFYNFEQSFPGQILKYEFRKQTYNKMIYRLSKDQNDILTVYLPRDEQFIEQIKN